MHPLASALAASASMPRDTAAGRRADEEWLRLHRRPDAPPCPQAPVTAAATSHAGIPTGRRLLGLRRVLQRGATGTRGAA